MNAAQLLTDLQREAATRAYITRVDVLDQSRTLLKVRLYISADLYVQVYRNDQFDTTNLVLLHGGRRLYWRDQVGGKWHRHTAADPQVHDKTAEGSHAVELAEFLDEVEAVLSGLGLP